MTTPIPAPAPPARPTFTSAERRTLRTLRDRYRQDRDLFTSRERAHLLFLRWMYRSGRLVD